MADIYAYDEVRVLKRNGYFGTVFPVLAIIQGTLAASSVNFSAPFFIADRPYEVLDIKERHEVAATDGTVDVVKAPSGTAPAAGTSVLGSAINLTAAANTNQTAVLTATLRNRRIETGDAITLVASGLLVGAQGVTVSAILKAI